ncbi:hypothetical protein DWZ08_08920 [Clostridiaceae bacterium AF29-16BH]|nr:hypothetical protein DWZ08_08920 [Clostridiaceae bacterium AF29-16BH]
MKKDTLRRADLIFSLVLMGISVFTLIESYSLLCNPFQRADITQEAIASNIADWYESIAIVPMILAVFIMICTIALFRFAWKEGARFDFIKKENVQKLLKNREFKVAVSITLILLVYIQGLLPLFRKTIDFFPKFQAFPFMIATFIMLFVMMIAFAERTKKHVVTSLIVSAVSAAAISYGFGMLALIPLP